MAVVGRLVDLRAVQQLLQRLADRGVALRGRARRAGKQQAEDEEDRRTAHWRDGTVPAPVIRRLSFLAVACALTITACGSSDALEGKDAAGVLKETFGPDHSVRSGRLDLGLRFNAVGIKELDGPLTARLSGPFEGKGGKSLPAVDLDLAVNAGGDAISAGVVSTGERGYLKLGGETYDVGADLYKSLNDGYRTASTQTERETKNSSPLSSLGIDPQRWLRSPEKAGEEDVGGATTVHVTAQVDVAKLLADVDTLLRKAPEVNVPGTKEKVTTRLTDAQQTAITESVKKATFDVWAGKEDGTLRRLRAEISFDIPEASRKGVGGLQSGTILIDLTISALNDDVKIEAPANARPLTELTGGSAAPSGASGGGGSTTPPAGSVQSQYLDCLQTAGEDLKEVQKCAALLGD